MIVTTSHATLINGKIYEAPANNVVELLQKRKQCFVFIRHSIDGKLPSIIYEYKGGELISSKKLFVLSRVSILRYITEILATYFYFLFKKHNVEISYIGVDPLNSLSGILLRKAGRFKKVIFYSVDFADKRFKSKVLNYMYHWIDSFCARNADQVWSVSYRIWKIRSKAGVLNKKNIFLPNVPSDNYKMFKNNKKKKYDLITLGIIDEQLDFIGIFDAISDLRMKYPEINLKIIGSGPREDEYQRYVVSRGLEKSIKFLGYLSHENALNEISRSGVGLALYNGKWNFNYYGDSMKCREYFCFGLPVITTDTHSTVEEINSYSVGIVCKMDKESYKTALINIFENYMLYSRNSYALADKYKNVHKNILDEL